MAQYNKEQLDALLQFIEKLCADPENSQWKDTLVSKLTQRQKTNKDEDKGLVRISKIEKYLGIDFGTDTSDSLVDYSFVQNKTVREQLKCDNREMQRYRLGVRYHNVDFEHFCLYALLQIEMLLNYFYLECSEYNIGTIASIIKQYNPKYNGSPKTISEIQTSIKVYALYNQYRDEFKAKNLNTVEIDYIRKVRNDVSHRDAVSANQDWNKSYNRLKNEGFPLLPDGKVHWGKLSEVQKYKLSEYLKEDWYKTYLFQLWLSKKPYNEVVQILKGIAEIVANHIQEKS